VDDAGRAFGVENSKKKGVVTMMRSHRHAEVGSLVDVENMTWGGVRQYG
jgi:hypothetical protein